MERTCQCFDVFRFEQNEVAAGDRDDFESLTGKRGPTVVLRPLDLVAGGHGLEKRDFPRKACGLIGLHRAPVLLAHLDAAEIAVGFRRTCGFGRLDLVAHAAVRFDAFADALAQQ